MWQSAFEVAIPTAASRGFSDRASSSSLSAVLPFREPAKPRAGQPEN